MELRETATLTDAALPVAQFRAHLRLGTGFADEAATDALLAGYLRAALATIEGRIGKALLRRGFMLVAAGWRWADAQALPIAPVTQVTAVTLIAAGGAPAVADPAQWRLVADAHRPRLVATGAVLPPVPQGGRVEVAFVAGLAEDWAGVPGDLRQAVLLLAAQLHEGRAGGAMLPAPVEGLLARWRPVRVGGAR